MRRFLLAYTIFVFVAFAGACAGTNRIEESPLSTWDPSESELFFHASSGDGTLKIASDCVRLIQETEIGQESVILVWPEPTSWNASSQTIDFVGVMGERLELRDGDKIRAGGAGYPVAESPEYIGEPAFVSPPAPSCNADELFVLNSISVVAD